MLRLSERLKTLSPYTAGEQPSDKKYIKLNTNENPYPPSADVYSALANFNVGGLKLYPDPSAVVLREIIAKKEGVKKENVFVGNGSDEVLAFAFYAMFDTVSFFDITYSFYPAYCRLYNINYEIIPLEQDFTADSDKLTNRKSGGLVIANPNAPTALALTSTEIGRAAKKREFPVLVDEAYIDFAESGVTAVPLIKNFENLLVVKTLSKSYSLAGLRCGYALGSSALISALETVRDSFNSYPVDALCQVLAAAALKDEKYHTECCDKIKMTRARVVDELKAAGISVLPSQTNFIFMSAAHLGIGGGSFYKALRERNILVRHFDKPRINGYVRVSIGTDSEMTEFIAAVNSILNF